MGIDIGQLIGKLDDRAQEALGEAVNYCVSRTHFNVEVEHFLLALLDGENNDANHIFRQFEVNALRMRAELEKALEKMTRGNSRAPVLSPQLTTLFQQAWVLGSIDFDHTRIRTGATVLAIAETEQLSQLVRGSSPEFRKIKAEDLRERFREIIALSSEEKKPAAPAAAAADEADSAPEVQEARINTPNLSKYTEDLTQKAREGKIDPVLGRDTETRQVIDILMRRRQNNPILTGEAGVGKTAVVEGFALRVAGGDVPPPLRNVTVCSLDLALLQAGAGVKGEFENRLKSLITEIKASPTPIILFIDEAHTMIGAGGQAGQNDAANLLKPALARGELRTIAATTWSEYKQYFENDAALARRFQVVKVEEPDEEKCAIMLRGITPALEAHHGVRILNEAVTAAVGLSHRYLTGRQLPDKAVSILDTACARVALAKSAIPPAIEDSSRRLEDLRALERILLREQTTGADHSERLAAVVEEMNLVEVRLGDLNARWKTEADLVNQIHETRASLENGAVADPAAAPGAREVLSRLTGALSQLQGEAPLMQVCVDQQIVGEVLSAWTGIPVGKMLKDEIETVLNLKELMAARVIGQDHALEAIAQRISTSRAGLEDPSRPIGVFLLVGPSGVGKTETALALADILYGGERSLITINMSEYQEAHSVSNLKGSPKGYVGYGEGGVLTEAVRKRPYSVILLDEVEKAHPDVREMFYQIFDKGTMEDAKGREINFRNAIILLTSNAATKRIMDLTSESPLPAPDEIAKAIKPRLDKVFKSAFLGRMAVVPYYPLRDAALEKVVHLKLEKIRKRALETQRLQLRFAEGLASEIAARCTEVESGARNIDFILANALLPRVSRLVLGSMASGVAIEAVSVSICDSGFQCEIVAAAG